MTYSDILNIINTAKALGSDPIRVEITDLASALFQFQNTLKNELVTLDDISAATGQIPKFNGTSWAAAEDATADAGTGVDADATITANRTWTMGNKTIILKNTSANSNPAIVFETDLTTNSQITHWRVKSPTETPKGRSFGLMSVVTQNATASPADPNSFNEVAKLGFNPDRAWEPTKNAFWDAWEPHWESGDALYLERHISIDAVNFPGENRLYSILTILRTSWATSDIIHLWKGSSYNWKDTTPGSGNDLMSLAKNGSAGSKLTLQGFIFEQDGVNNLLNFYPASPGSPIDATLDMGASKWARYRFRNGKLNIELGTYTSSANAQAFGLQLGDFYTDGSGNVKIVI